MAAVLAIVEQHGRWGFGQCFNRLRLDGHPWNHKRVHRVYRALRLNLPRRTKRRVPDRRRQPLVAPTVLNGIWALDCRHAALYGGRPFRTLNILDEANREAWAIAIGTSIPAARVVRVLEQLVVLYGRPQAVRLDNGADFPAEVFTAWCAEQQTELRYIQPGKLDQNAFIARFNRTDREEVLDAYVFASVSEVQAGTDAWLPGYNECRPHDALRRIPPARFLPRPPTPSESSNAWCP
jgi:putative transposase